MQTARRATASITDAGDYCIPVLGFLNKMGICWRAVIGFDGLYDLGDPVFCKQFVFERVKERDRVFLSVRDNTQCGSFER